MSFLTRTNLALFGSACLIVASCGMQPRTFDALTVGQPVRYDRTRPTGPARLFSPPATELTPAGLVGPPNAFAAGNAAVRRADDVTLVRAAAILRVADTQAEAAVGSPTPAATWTAVSATPVPMNVAAVMACIRNAESGDYTESSHLDEGSGAYQFTPGTWEAWSARAGHPGYEYAYEAPPAVQDAVTAYTLINGGAHNWDPAYGNDSCTVGWNG